VNGPIYLAWRYLVFHRWKSAILIAAITLVFFLPAALQILVDQSARELTARADATPLLVGARGSALELVLNSLYFDSAPPTSTSWAQAERVEADGLAEAIPLYTRFRVRSHPIVGTSLAYLDFRGLRLASGRPFAVLGECVVGADVADALDVGPGDSVVSSPENVFDLAGVYPLKMTVVGVLERTLGADDDAIFVDVKTTWVIEGLGHGHQDLEAPEAASGVLGREEGRIIANASVVQYNEITPDNIDSFHFHGDNSEFPLTAVLAVPRDEKSSVILMGRYQGGVDEPAQIVEPRKVMDDLLATILTIRSFVLAGIVLVGAAALATAALVFLLSMRLRRREIETIFKLGGSRGAVVTALLSEMVSVLLLGGLIAAALVWLTSQVGSAALRAALAGLGA
jgi:putative ABC transport system permease protein